MIAFATSDASSTLLSRPKLTRMVPSAYSCGTPIAFMTCETCVFTESHAEPVEIDIHFKSSR